MRHTLVRFAPMSAILPALLALGACATPAPPPPPPLPLIVPSQLPPMPVPPLGATTGMYIPQPGIDGLRPTPNRGLSTAEAIWHFRSAYNVAALNCQDAGELQLAPEYNNYIKLHAVALNIANKSVDAAFRARFNGANGLRVRDTRMTDVYNYFALPPVNSGFCTLMVRKSRELQILPTAQLGDYSIRSLAEVDALFLGFYDAYDRYKRELAAWQSLYGVRARVTVLPGVGTVPPAAPVFTPPPAP